MTTLNDIFDSLLLAKGEELADTVPDGSERRTLGTVAYAVGFQAALELAMLDESLARRLIDSLHQRQEHDSPGSSEEFNTTALQLIEITKRLVTA